MRDYIAVLAMCVIAGMAFLHPGLVIAVLILAVITVFILFSLVFFLLGAPPPVDDGDNHDR